MGEAATEGEHLGLEFLVGADDGELGGGRSEERYGDAVEGLFAHVRVGFDAAAFLDQPGHKLLVVVIELWGNDV